MVNVMQQLGGSVGLAVLVAVFGTASRAAIAHPPAATAALSAVARQHYALAHGMSAAFSLAALFDIATLLLVIFLFRGAPRNVATSGQATAPAERDAVPVPE
jgi:hypothetical protein